MWRHESFKTDTKNTQEIPALALSWNLQFHSNGTILATRSVMKFFIVSFSWNFPRTVSWSPKYVTHKEEFMCLSFLLNINEIFMLHSKQATKHLMKPILALGLWAINKLGVLSIIWCLICREGKIPIMLSVMAISYVY